jgi:hypothetical protein
MTSMSLLCILVFLLESSYLQSASACISFRPYQKDSSLDCWVTVEESVRQTNGRQTQHHQLVCYPIINGHQSDFLLVLDGLPNTFAKEHSKALENGELFIALDHAVVVQEEQIIHVRAQSSLTVVPPPPKIQRPRRLTTTGDLTIAFVRVSMKDAQVTSSAQDIKEVVMGENSANMINQLHQNSFGKLCLQPAGGGVGVYEVYVNKNIGSYAQGSSTHTDVQNAIREQLNVETMQDLADRVFFCIPPGTIDPNWVAVASERSGIASFNNEYCSSLSTTIHEFMHTIGLGHSHLAVDGDYWDLTCYQGGSIAATDWPQQMFNAHKHWQLGWFADRHASFDPIALQRPVTIEIAAIVDYNKTAEHQPVIVEIGTAYYMQYNRVKGFNFQNQQEKDRIVVVQDLGGRDSKRVGGVGDSIGSINIDYLSSGRALTIQVCETRYGSIDTEPDVMVVSVGFGTADCSAPPLLESLVEITPEVSEPSSSPSKSPVATPTQAPTTLPSVAPSEPPSSTASHHPSWYPVSSPIMSTIQAPSVGPSTSPSLSPSVTPSQIPSASPSLAPSSPPSSLPNESGPSASAPSPAPSLGPRDIPSNSTTTQAPSQPSSTQLLRAADTTVQQPHYWWLHVVTTTIANERPITTSSSSSSSLSPSQSPNETKVAIMPVAGIKEPSTRGDTDNEEHASNLHDWISGIWKPSN